MNFIITIALVLLSQSGNLFAHEMQLLSTVEGAEGYEFAIYPNGVEKIIPSPGPFVDLNDLPFGDYKYKLRIKKENQWSPWSNVSELSVAKKSKSLKILKISEVKETIAEPKVADLRLAPFLFYSARSIDAKNDDVKKKSNGNAVRIGANLDSKYYSSQAFYETGKVFSRTDIGVMRTLSPYFQLGGKVLFATAKFSDSGKTARINSIHAFIQATGKYETRNNFLFSLNGAGTVQGSLLANLFLAKSWLIQDKFKLSPTIGYEELMLKSSGTRLNSSSFLAGIFVEFPL